MGDPAKAKSILMWDIRQDKPEKLISVQGFGGSRFFYQYRKRIC